jgi:hypothetical protein
LKLTVWREDLQRSVTAAVLDFEERHGYPPDDKSSRNRMRSLL